MKSCELFCDIQYEKSLDFLRKHNTGTCPKTGKTFGELIEHFVLNGDETNLMADNDGNVKIIGEFGRQKHKKRVSDCKASATMYRFGSAGGDNGPTVFVMAEERVAAGYTPDF